MFVIFEHVPLLSQAFDLASGGMLPYLIPVYSYIFDRWNPDMIWHIYVLPGACIRNTLFIHAGLINFKLFFMRGSYKSIKYKKLHKAYKKSKTNRQKEYVNELYIFFQANLSFKSTPKHV